MALLVSVLSGTLSCQTKHPEMSNCQLTFQSQLPILETPNVQWSNGPMVQSPIVKLCPALPIGPQMSPLVQFLKTRCGDPHDTSRLTHSRLLKWIAATVKAFCKTSLAMSTSAEFAGRRFASGKVM